MSNKFFPTAKKKKKREEQRFGAYRCNACGHRDVYRDLSAVPVHCGQEMRFLHVMFQGSDPDAVNIDVILIWPPSEKTQGKGSVWFGPSDFWIYTAPSINWHYAEETPEAIWEVYQLRPGRYNGERIGWIGRRADKSYEFRAPPGVREESSRGVRLSRNACVEALVEAVNEG